MGGLIGRGEQLRSLQGTLAAHHLVTVTGRAGVGKSCLAAAAVAGTSRSWRRVVRVRWDGRGPGEPGALAAAVFRALHGRHARPEVPGHGDLVRQLTAPGVLLFLDDVDPVHRECTRLVQRLLAAVPALRVVVTSRRALGLGEEQVVELPPLETRRPADGARPAAVELFLARARAAVEGFRADETDLTAVEAICRSLEGVPHAIGLAAEQLARRSVGELADALERDQCWLHSGSPRLSRHRSLRDTVGSSYLLCEREVRIVWARASVLAGAFSESTGVFLCAGGSVDPEHVPSLLAQLAAMRVIEPVGDPGGPRPPRYRMTRAARDFGDARLREAGEFEQALERRAAHRRQLAGVAEGLWVAGCQSQAVRLVREEQEELTALRLHAPECAGEAQASLEAMVSLWFWWLVHDRAPETLGCLTRLLSYGPPDSEAARNGRWLAAWLSAAEDPQAALGLLGPAWPQAVLAGDDAAVGRIAHVQGVLALHGGDAEAAAEHFAEAAALIPVGAVGGPSPAVSLAAQAVAEAGFAPGAASRTARRVLTRPDLRDDAWAVLTARYAQACADHRRGRRSRARNRAGRALAALDGTLPEPPAVQALRALITSIEAGVPSGPDLPPLPSAT
ncbi:hypothetical protein [Streptomyces sp. AC627_RSS907]|uniref:ATP-binding protein n=1 Tax=Streptomyces sp. AC627_RSS907 TaxID=2823684 RepID=UPI001C247B4B|nr:hypothetical protein [Streptomyces sp. AC627_RSS907]